jgi:hypothetical protein
MLQWLDYDWSMTTVFHSSHVCVHVPWCLQQVSGLNCVIIVKRFNTRWVLSAIFPIMATTWLAFLVFFLPRDDMNGRLGE